MEKRIRTVCQSCHCECGVIVHVKDGRVTKVEGDLSHPMNKGFIEPRGRS